MERQKILAAIYDAIDEINELLEEEQKLEKSVDTALFDKSGKLDSLGLVNFVVAAEENIHKELGIFLNLSDAIVAQQENSPFRTVGTLVNFISNSL
jgi:acyl carrier protein